MFLIKKSVNNFQIRASGKEGANHEAPNDLMGGPFS